jgi:osmoprotectant transport system permease protein
MRSPRVDRLGTMLCAIMVAGLLLPFVVFKSNRIVPGDPHGLAAGWSPAAALVCYAIWLLVGTTAICISNTRVRLFAALAGLAVLLTAVAVCADHLTPMGNKVVRIAPGAGFWLLFLGLGLLATDGVARLRLRPRDRVLALVAFVAVASVTFALGAFDNLSVNSDRFAREARQHALLVVGSLGAAVVVALPIGVLCHRLPRVRAAVLPTLNIVQTIPAIALFGILMAPLGALAAAVPLAGKLGISGIGAAPAVVALFVYSLLPIVANTTTGLRRVSAAAVDAARGMGMTPWQILTSVELALALPVILTGIRIVLVQNIGLATIAALIGGGGLGAFVFQGIGQTATDLVLLGAIPTVALAFCAGVLLDALVEVLDRSKQ